MWEAAGNGNLPLPITFYIGASLKSKCFYEGTSWKPDDYKEVVVIIVLSSLIKAVQAGTFAPNSSRLSVLRDKKNCTEEPNCESYREN